MEGFIALMCQVVRSMTIAQRVASLTFDHFLHVKMVFRT
ncbi:hypothetical protein MY1_1486 [Nitrosarchaeum koreense MY1]|uniref:Uncharacterized protein n=1 Tax=Nitrosarchaeum koreense MY1 TaxID=1001994 RepID=F9CZ83_9ARCH|nr:hypothetical protein MY1_1486 [Nitrosarchaeum koreense MY1]